MAEGHFSATSSSFTMNEFTNIGIIKEDRLRVKPGQVFSRLTVVGNEFSLRRDGGERKRFVVAQCECGKFLFVNSMSLVRLSTHSCGCFRSECLVAKNKDNSTHGQRNTPIYRSWRGMKNRCYNRKIKEFARYGARGITVCDEWRNDFQSFYEWSIKNGWQEGLSVDRIDNNSGYSPDNCRWATDKQQSNNRRDNISVTHNGRTMTLAQWSREPQCIVSLACLRQRLRAGMPFSEATMKPSRRKSSNGHTETYLPCFS